MTFEITERWLMDAGGWQAMKPARAAWQAGAVLAVEFDGTRLRGQVRSGGRTLAAGLIIKSRSDVTNLCACPQSRRDGALCEHSLALGLAWVHRRSGPTAEPSTQAPIRSAAPPHPNTHAASTVGATRHQPTTPVLPRTSGALIITLPPTFFDGLQRQRLALSLKPAPAGTDETDADRAVHSWIASHRLTSVPPQLALADRGQIESLLHALDGHSRVRVGATALTVTSENVRIPLRILKSPKNTLEIPDNQKITRKSKYLIQPDLSTTQSPEKVPETDALGLEIDPSKYGEPRWWAGSNHGLLYFESSHLLFITKDILLVFPFFADPARPRSAMFSLAWLARHGEAFSDVFEVDEADPQWPKLILAPEVPKFRLSLDGSARRLTARLWCRYDGVEEFLLPHGELRPDPFPRADPKAPGVFRDRHRTMEASAEERLRHCGFVFDPSERDFVLNNEPGVLQFYAGELAAMERDWVVEFGARAREAFRTWERITPSFREVASGNDWLAFDLSMVGSGGSTVSAAEARRWLQTGQGSKRLPNGRMAVLSREAFEDIEEVLRDLSADQEHGHFRVARSQKGYLESSLLRLGEESTGGRVGEVESPEVASRWATVLRPYQDHGARWMLQLAASEWGGILADEMGLGKTVQTLAVIDSLPAAGDPAELAPCLVVAPTSLLGNWREEATRFAPDLKVLVVRSGERSRELAGLESADLVITSYQLLVRDIDHHRRIRYRAVFLDEAGFIRNPDTLSAKAVRRIVAGARFALTGTPVENSIRDLWAIMDFVMPGYLGRRDDFRERYEAPILAGDGGALDRLRRRMAPYWLRRLKQDVARELPAKIESIVRCELTATQRDIYAAIQREGVKKVEEARQAHTPAQARLTMLTALLRLRQTCGDPRLLGESYPDRDPSEFSGKWAALIELLEEIRDGGHSVLIFSQFSTQLKLLEPALTTVGLDYCRLDGASRDREAQVAAFRDDPKKRAFLISLKAGGFGLNLTKADTVIHFDPWWNPAVEAQATDRAHRIGQSRPVTVYKLIAAGTVEEKILLLQRRKRQLMDSTLADEAAPLMEALDDEALNDLLRAPA